jgi:heptosyltransferase I
LALFPDVVTPDGPDLFPAGEAPTVCIVLLSGIGDVVHGLPLAWDVRSRNPDARVVWVAEPAPAQVLHHHPAVDRVVVYRTRDGLGGLRELRRTMADVDADLTLNVQRYLKSAWPTLFSGAPTRVGLPPSKTRDGIRLVHTHVLRETPWKHSQDLFLDFRWALGVGRDAPARWGLAFSDEERAAQEAFLETLDPDRPVASLVLASANPKKDWTAEGWAELADRLAGEMGFQVLLLGGPSARERTLADAVLAATRTPPRDCLGDSVRRLMWLVDASDLVAAPDTGPLHIAHALDVPVVGLFAHTNPWRVGPWQRYRDLVVDRYTEPGDAPDPAGYLPKDHRMDTISVEDVLERVEIARERYL